MGSRRLVVKGGVRVCSGSGWGRGLAGIGCRCPGFGSGVGVGVVVLGGVRAWLVLV